MASRLEQCMEALRQVEEYDRQFPSDPALASVANQLRYLIQIERGEESDRSRLASLTMGRHAVYGLSGLISDDLSKLICAISNDVKRQLRAEGRPPVRSN
jgi:hypothetical protein